MIGSYESHSKVVMTSGAVARQTSPWIVTFGGYFHSARRERPARRCSVVRCAWTVQTALKSMSRLLVRGGRAPYRSRRRSSRVGVPRGSGSARLGARGRGGATLALVRVADVRHVRLFAGDAPVRAR